MLCDLLLETLCRQWNVIVLKYLLTRFMMHLAFYVLLFFINIIVVNNDGWRNYLF